MDSGNLAFRQSTATYGTAQMHCHTRSKISLSKVFTQLSNERV